MNMIKKIRNNIKKTKKIPAQNGPNPVQGYYGSNIKYILVIWIIIDEKKKKKKKKWLGRF